MADRADNGAFGVREVHRCPAPVSPRREDYLGGPTSPLPRAVRGGGRVPGRRVREGGDGAAVGCGVLFSACVVTTVRCPLHWPAVPGYAGALDRFGKPAPRVRRV